MKRMFLVAGAACAAAALIAVGATSASSSGKTLHLKGTKISSSTPGAKVGTLYIQAESVTGDDSGRDAVACTIATKQGLVCTFALSLKGGQITSAGLVDLTKTTFDIAIQGGTGSYDNAGGTITVVNTSQTQTAYTVKLD